MHQCAECVCLGIRPSSLPNPKRSVLGSSSVEILNMHPVAHQFNETGEFATVRIPIWRDEASGSSDLSMASPVFIEISSLIKIWVNVERPHPPVPEIDGDVIAKGQDIRREWSIPIWWEHRVHRNFNKRPTCKDCTSEDTCDRDISVLAAKRIHVANSVVEDPKEVVISGWLPNHRHALDPDRLDVLFLPQQLQLIADCKAHDVLGAKHLHHFLHILPIPIVILRIASNLRAYENFGARVFEVASNIAPPISPVQPHLVPVTLPSLEQPKAAYRRICVWKVGRHVVGAPVERRVIHGKALLVSLHDIEHEISVAFVETSLGIGARLVLEHLVAILALHAIISVMHNTMCATCKFA